MYRPFGNVPREERLSFAACDERTFHIDRDVRLRRLAPLAGQAAKGPSKILLDVWPGKTFGPEHQDEGSGRRSPPSAVTAAIAASLAAVTPVAATRIGGIVSLHVGIGVVGRLRSVAEAVIVARSLTVSVAIAGSGTMTVAAGTRRPAAATTRAPNAAAVAAGRSTATSRVSADGGASRSTS